MVGIRQDYRIIVSVLVGASGLLYHSQCVGGCLRTRITVSVLVASQDYRIIVSVLVGASGLVLQSVCWWVPQDYRITCLMLRRH